MKKSSGINYQAWSESLIGFIRAKGLEPECTEWCGGWKCPIENAAHQHIETAPKDGSHILAWRIPVGIRVTNNTNPPTVVHWFDDGEASGFYTSVNEIAPEYPFNPTHWMPLPGAPSISLERSGGAT